MAYKSVTVDVDIDLDEFETDELVLELERRAKKGDDEAKEALNHTACNFADGEWVDVESALFRKDFDWIARWLWPQVRRQWPRHVYHDQRPPAKAA
jgi:hypothetical protein